MEAYKPTPQEIQNMRMSPDSLKLSGDGAFFTFQGEGQSIGKPAVFLRLQTCNLRCSWCDTPYAVFPDRQDYWQEPQNRPISEVSELVRGTWSSDGEKRLVITGGEPMIQQKQIAKLLEQLPDFKAEIETNGTIPPIQELMDRVQFNVSPKLENSGNPNNLRFRMGALRRLNAVDSTTFKFVVTGEKDIAEIQRLVDYAKLDPHKIIIMPEGVTVEALREHANLVDEVVRERGWRLMTRMQIELWGQKRRT